MAALATLTAASQASYPLTSEPQPLAEIATRCLADGVSGLSAEEQSRLKELFLKETRKKAFEVVGHDTDAIRAQFCKHVQDAFGVPASVLAVIDCLPYFERTAKGLVNEDPIPLTALILYGAWIEHWVNVFLTVALLRNGEADQTAARYLNDTRRFENKVTRIRDLSTATIPEGAFGWIAQLMEKRKKYVHYLWKGVPRRSINDDVKHIRSLVRNGEAQIKELRTFEHQNFDAALVPIAVQLFPLAA